MKLRFDFNNMFDFNVGSIHGVTLKELNSMSKSIQTSHRHLRSLIATPYNRKNLGLEWTQLPYQEKDSIEKIEALGKHIAKRYKNVIFLGIGGSYLGLKAAQDALASAYFNDFAYLKTNRARIYFEGNNLDPTTLNILIKNLDPRKTAVVVISKSGETLETKAGFEIVSNWLRKSLGKNYARSIFAITDAVSGSLRRLIQEFQGKDNLKFRSLTLFKGVGGRYSELNMGLLHLAIIGVRINEVLNGAKLMDKICLSESIWENPAYMYASLNHILYRKKSKFISIMMPFCEGLKSTADWYMQLLAESTGKKFARKIKVYPDGREEWLQDVSKKVYLGRTPISSRGTSDLHSLHQNNVQGENNKVITFVSLEKFKTDLKIPVSGGFIGGRRYSQLLQLAQQATEWALVQENRPNCTIILPELNASTWGQLIYFLEMATAFEGELLNVNAYDQPGVESYKNYMYYKLKKPNVSQEIAKQIKKLPLVKKAKFII